MNVDELEIAVLYLSGEIRQGRIGIGPSMLRDNVAQAAEVPSLELVEVDGWLTELGRDPRQRFGRAPRDGPARIVRDGPPGLSRNSCCGCWWANCGRARWPA
jgi:hypothetical protein